MKRTIGKYKDWHTQELLGYFGAAVGILRSLETSNKKMYYSDFAKTIGMPRATRFKVADLLHALGAIDGIAGAGPKLKRERIVDKRTGKPSQGFYKTPKIVIED